MLLLYQIKVTKTYKYLELSFDSVKNCTKVHVPTSLRRILACSDVVKCNHNDG